MSSQKKPTFLVTGADLAGDALALLSDYEVVFTGKTPTEDDIVALCKRHDPVAVIVRYSKVGAAAMDAAPSLRVISKHGSGTDTIDKVAAKARGVEVVAAVDANAAAVAEQALALLLACAKSVVTLDERMHAGHWDKATHKSVEIEGRTVGVIGLGAIGLRFARMADALGMRVLDFDPFAKALEPSLRQRCLPEAPGAPAPVAPPTPGGTRREPPAGPLPSSPARCRSRIRRRWRPVGHRAGGLQREQPRPGRRTAQPRP